MGLLLLAALAPALDVGHVIDNGVVHDDAILDVDSTGTGWVRINFRLDAWETPDDPTPHGPDGLTWYAAYDRVVDAYLARGIEVYGLINDEAVGSSLDHTSDAWISLYVQNAVKIVDHFKNRVRTFEIINEPNDYAGGSSARFPADRFAKILQDTYLAVKHDAGHLTDRCWQVSLVSGPLFSFDATPSADYLANVYAAGRNTLAWDYTHQVTGSYPLDGVGYHVYVAQGADSTTADVASGVGANLDALWSTIAANEGAGTNKQIWISEFGWRADVVGDAAQAERFHSAFSAMQQQGHVALATYFTYKDFPDNDWGVFAAGGTRRPSADMLDSLAQANRPAHAARVVNIQAPVLAPGATGDVIVTLVNRGTAAWSDGWRLGAAPGCPEAASENAVAWMPANGYANTLTDARVFLDHAVAPGESIDVHVPIVAPAEPGTYTFAARMVDEGVTWFGPTVTAQIDVMATPDSGTGSGSGDGSEHDGGCNAEGGAGWLVALASVFATRRRRLRQRV